MKIINVVNIIGRGTIIVCRNNDGEKFSCGDYVVIEESEYKIIGIERLSSYSTLVGIVISRQDDIDKIKQNDILTIKYGNE